MAAPSAGTVFAASQRTKWGYAGAPSPPREVGFANGGNDGFSVSVKGRLVFCDSLGCARNRPVWAADPLLQGLQDYRGAPCGRQVQLKNVAGSDKAFHAHDLIWRDPAEAAKSMNRL
jgi:hypothetical protein